MLYFATLKVWACTRARLESATISAAVAADNRTCHLRASLDHGCEPGGLGRAQDYATSNLIEPQSSEALSPDGRLETRIGPDRIPILLEWNREYALLHCLLQQRQRTVAVAERQLRASERDK